MSSSREGAVLRGEAASRAVAQWSGQDRRHGERRSWGRRATDPDAGWDDGGRPGVLLADVYAEELDRLREAASAEGYAAGHAEGLRAAADVIAHTERAAAERLTEVQARWERRLASATAALTVAATRLQELEQPSAAQLRDSVVEAVLTLVEDLLGRELSLADSPAMDAIRRALTLCPTDGPVVVRVHPDDLAEVPEDALAQLPASVRVLADDRIERAGAVAEAGTRRIDAQLGAALQRVQAVLTS